MVDKVKNAYSLYSDQQILDHFPRDSRVARPRREHFVVCSPCKLSDRVCHISNVTNDTVSAFFFVYVIFFSTLGIRLLFTDFEVKCLNFLSVTPTQLHPNSWAFIYSFEALMTFADAIRPLGSCFPYSK